jgi:hypothetical protein
MRLEDDWGWGWRRRRKKKRRRGETICLFNKGGMH